MILEYDVTIGREYYIGGSDLPIIMGISPFKTRYQLLLEKSGLAECEFEGNRYTVYGQKLEPSIREYINSLYCTNFVPNRVIEGDIRGHSDGFNGEAVLEIKTTSKIYDTVDEYKVYLVQLLKYMEMNKVEKGILCVYERPTDFNDVFDPSRCRIYEISMSEYKDLMQEINNAIERFRADLERLKNNPLLTEQDFQPNELVLLSNKVMVLENRMAEFKEIEKQYKSLKKALYEAMQSHDVKSWQTPNNTRITRVDGSKGTVELITEFDVDKFKEENPELYEQYLVQREKKVSDRAGYVLVTLP